MTRRERLERKAEKRREWAAKAKGRSAAGFDAAKTIADGIPLGQPILVGHHSEARHRRDLGRIDAGMRRGCAEQAKAAGHEEKAAGLERQLARSVYSDDTDAVQALEARIAQNEATATRYAEINKAWKKGGAEALRAIGCSEKIIETCARTMSLAPWFGKPLDTGNIRAAIRRDKARIAEIERRAEKTAVAEAGGGVLIVGEEYVTVTFAEKPDRAILEAIRAGGFHWSGGSWYGQRAKLPEGLRG